MIPVLVVGALLFSPPVVEPRVVPVTTTATVSGPRSNQDRSAAASPSVKAVVEITQRDPTSAPGSSGPRPDIVVTARARSFGDPLQAVNARSFAVTQVVDMALIGPAALAYQRHVPRPFRSGARNFLNNLHEPDVFLNYLLQRKPGKAAETFGRFAVNSTIGAAGLIDVARRRPFRLPRRPNGFGDTFGYYGIKPGPFFFLPVIGPVTLRDLVGGAMDRLLLPVAVGAPFNQLAYTVPTGVLSGLDRRAEFDGQLTELRGTIDPYSARRDFYLHRRQAEIDRLQGRSEVDAFPTDPPPADAVLPPASPDPAR